MDLRFFNERLDFQKFELRCQNEGRLITRFECNGDVLLIQYSKLEDNERLVFRGNDIIYTLILLIYNMNFDNMEFQYFELKLVMNTSNRLLRVVNNSGSFY